MLQPIPEDQMSMDRPDLPAERDDLVNFSLDQFNDSGFTSVSLAGEPVMESPGASLNIRETLSPSARKSVIEGSSATSFDNQKPSSPSAHQSVIAKASDNSEASSSSTRQAIVELSQNDLSPTRSSKTQSVPRKSIRKVCRPGFRKEPKLQRHASHNWFQKNHTSLLPNNNGRVYNTLETPGDHFTHLAFPNGEKAFMLVSTAIVIGIASATLAIPDNHLHQTSGHEFSGTGTGSIAMFVGQGSKYNTCEMVHVPLVAPITNYELSLSLELLSCLQVLHEAFRIKETFERQNSGTALACIVIKSSSERCVLMMTQWLANVSKENWLKTDGTFVWQHSCFQNAQQYIDILRALGTTVYFSFVTPEKNATALCWAESVLKKHSSLSV